MAEEHGNSVPGSKRLIDWIVEYEVNSNCILSVDDIPSALLSSEFSARQWDAIWPGASKAAVDSLDKEVRYAYWESFADDLTAATRHEASQGTGAAQGRTRQGCASGCLVWVIAEVALTLLFAGLALVSTQSLLILLFFLIGVPLLLDFLLNWRTDFTNWDRFLVSIVKYLLVPAILAVVFFGD